MIRTPERLAPVRLAVVRDALRTRRRGLLVLLAATLAACEPTATTTPSPRPSPVPERRIQHDLGDPAGPAPTGGGESVYAVTRFTVERPVRVVAIEAVFHVEQAGSGHVALYADEGHNFYDFLREAPIAQWTPSLAAQDDGSWRRFDLDPPFDLTQPGLLYLGGHEAETPLAVDDAVSDDPWLRDHGGDPVYPPSFAVYPDRGTDAYGFETVVFAGGGSALAPSGDLLVRLVVQDIAPDPAPWFVDRTDATGLSGSGSPSFIDCDDDGLVDVFDGALRRNLGGRFEPVADSGITAGGPGAWGDYDDDGVADLFVAGTVDALYRGLGDCRFEDVSATAGIDDTQPFRPTQADAMADRPVPTVAAAWLDYDSDGLLDLYQASWGSFDTEDYGVDRLWRNRGDGTFEDVTNQLGMVTPQGPGLAGRGVAVTDWDLDGDPDVYVSNYRLQRNLAWRNDSGFFTDMASTTAMGGQGTSNGPFTAWYGHTIGSAWGDIDGDGDPDLFAANLAHPRFLAFSNQSMLLRNDLGVTGPEFVAIRDEAGLDYQETESSPVFFDADNDGDLDLFVTAVYPARPAWLYLNDGAGRFERRTWEAGAALYDGWGVSAADLDGDGDLDLYGKRLLMNEREDLPGSVAVEVEGLGAGATNRLGIGVRMTLTPARDGAASVTREVSPSVGTGCGLPLEQHLGLGDASTGTLTVSFPVTGAEVKLEVAAGDRWWVREDGATDLR